MANTYVKIASVTIGSGGASTATFSGIPQTGYTDLVVKVSARSNRTGTDVDDELRMEFNNNTSGYSTRMIEGTTSVRSTADSGSNFGRGTIPTDNATANTFGNTEYYIPNYTGSANKSVSFDSVAENNASFTVRTLVAALWSNTAAITSIKLSAIGTFEQYSTFTLYGIKNS